MNSDNQYDIFYGKFPGLRLTSSLQEFLEHFLRGNVFDTTGLYEWRDEVQSRQDVTKTGLGK